MPVFIDFKKEDMGKLMELGLAVVETKSYYETARMSGSCTAVLFKSGKLLLQGNPERIKPVLSFIRGLGYIEKKAPEFVNESGIVIGSDETLKGDTFGGLVVAGVRADEIERENLRLLGVMDSKKMTDEQVLRMCDEVEKLCSFEIREVYPEEYNKHKQTMLLNKLHREVGEKLNVLGSVHYVDEYPGCRVGIHTTKAESKYIEVAAASIIARAVGLRQLQDLSKKLAYNIPKGSTHVKEALEFLKKSQKAPNKFVKMHFKNVILGLK